MIFSFIGSALGLGSSIYGAVTGPSANQASGQASAASGALYNYGNSLLNNGTTGQAYGNLQSYLNNPYSQNYVGGNQTAQNFGYGAGFSEINSGNALQGTASGQRQYINSALPYAQQELQTAFDPQTALYNQTANQTMQQSNAINSMNGVASSPYGAGLAAQNQQNFNIGWQNNQLSRETQGIDAYTKALSGANQGLSGLSSAYGAAGNLQTGGTNALQTAAGWPYNAYSSIYSGNLNQLNNYYDVASQATAPLAASIKGNLAIANYASGQSAQYGKGIGSALTSLGNSNVGQSIYSGLSNFFGGSSGGSAYSNAGLTSAYEG